MTVAELIRALRKLDQSAEVFARDDEEQPETAHGEDGDAWIANIESVETDDDGFVILCCVACEDDEAEGDSDDEDGDDEEELDPCD